MLENKDLGDRNQADGSVDEPPTDAAPAEVHSGLPVEPQPEAIRRLESENSELRDRQLRLAAEFDNFRKRVAKERIELSDRAQAALAVKLLEVLDDLDRVVAGGQASGATAEAVQQGLVMIDKKLRKELEAAGLERVDPAGQPFDPAVAEAVSVLPPPEPARDHTVSATFQAGYRFKGALIRPAMVQVFSSEGHA